MTNEAPRILNRFSPGEIVQILLLLIAVVGIYYQFSYRIEALERWRMEHEEAQKTTISEMQRKDTADLTLGQINQRLSRIEKKLGIEP